MQKSKCRVAGVAACAALLVAWTPPAVANANLQSSPTATVQQLSSLVTRVLDASPDIRAAQAAVETARARLKGAGFPLNNPELEAGFERTDINTYTVGVSQTIDWHDKRSSIEEVARAELASAEARVEERRLALAGELALAVGRITARSEVKALSNRRTEIFERFVSLAERSYEAGEIPQADLELVRLAHTEALLKHAGISAALVEARSDYLALSGQPFAGQVDLPDRLPSTLPEPDDAEALVRGHPRLRAMHSAAVAARRQVRVADRQRMADPTLGLAVGRDGRERLLGVSISIPLQVRNDLASTFTASQYEALQAEQDAEQVFRRLQARLVSARESYNLVAQAWALWESTGRRSLQEGVRLLEVAWQAGEMGTAIYLQQVQQALDTRISAVELHEELWSAWLEWQSVSGSLLQWLSVDAKEQ